MERNGKDAPENQDEPKLIFGKFKTMEEAEDSIKESERKLTELNETVSRLERIVSLSATEPPRTVTNKKEDYVPAYNDEDLSSLDEATARAIRTAEERAYTRAISDFATAASRKEAADREWKLFVKENPDLEEHADLVSGAATSYRTEIGNRAIDFVDMRKEVARRVRSKIETIRKSSSGAPIRVESGNEGERQPRIIRNEEEKPISQEEIVSTYIKDFQSRKQKQLGIRS